ncbi:MAG: LysR family transcriptional regulator [SAR86 cluster bacterium]|jgi:DNA-binding transcriptional LysR family regulator|nr:LysR family transcriptional regulator [SAR86 cluster bacterium]|tara:strand:+ start:4589 stop:5488 length:900 start_codon:yes stop_codon:yes gene_type:complete
MRYRHIEVFYSVFIHGSVTKAAHDLNVTQPSISKILSQSESDLGIKLFERLNKKMIPTQEAKILFPYAQKIHNNLSNFKKVSSNLVEKPQGDLNIAATHALGIDYLPEAISKFSALNSKATFETVTLHYEEIIKQVLELKVDVGIVYDPVPHDDLINQPIINGKFVVIAPQSFFPNKTEVNIDDIKTQPFIKITDKVGPRGPLGSKLEEYLLKNSLNLNPTFNTETYQVALALVSKGMGITITDKISAESSSHPNIKILELKPDLEFSLEIVYSKSNPLSLINKSFISFLSNFEYHNDI